MENKEKPKSQWQMNKEAMYDKVPLNVHQLDIIIGIGLAALAVVFVLICLDAAGIIG